MQSTTMNEGLSQKETLAVMIDRVQLNSVEVVVTDFGNAGCKVISDRLDAFSGEVMLQIKGIEEVFLGQIQQREHRAAKVKFQWNDTEATDNRQEGRRDVSITATICNRDGSNPLRCKVSKVSKTGCRIEAYDISKLRDETLIEMQGMHAPVKGEIIWRGNKCAGVKLLWNAAKEAAARPPAEMAS